MDGNRQPTRLIRIRFFFGNSFIPIHQVPLNAMHQQDICSEHTLKLQYWIGQLKIESSSPYRIRNVIFFLLCLIKETWFSSFFGMECTYFRNWSMLTIPLNPHMSGLRSNYSSEINQFQKSKIQYDAIVLTTVTYERLQTSRLLMIL